MGNTEYTRKKLTEQEIQEIMQEGWSREDIERGFGIFVNDAIMGGAEHIEKIDDVGMYDGDSIAAEVAESEYGIKLIHDIPYDKIHDTDIANFVDNPENRELISKYLKKEYDIDWR